MSKPRSTTIVQFRIANIILEAYKDKWESKNQSVNLYTQTLFINHLTRLPRK